MKTMLNMNRRLQSALYKSTHSLTHSITHSLPPHRTSRCPPLPQLRRGVVVSGVRRMNEVNARRAQIVPGWVTVFGRVYNFGM